MVSRFRSRLFHALLVAAPVVATPILVAGEARAGTTVQYFGGRVITNAQVIEVLWGHPVNGAVPPSYADGIRETGQGATLNLSNFFDGFLTSSYVGWLSEYDTFGTSTPPTNAPQHIGQGKFVKQVIVTPPAGLSGMGTMVDTASIGGGLYQLITSHALSPPAKDADGNTVTIYDVFLPHGAGLAGSCNDPSTQFLFSAGFCGIHYTYLAADGTEIYYAVFPDIQRTPGVDPGSDPNIYCFNCASDAVAPQTPAPPLFDKITRVVSHELVETLTDPEGGLQPGNFSIAPHGWDDVESPFMGVELCDICSSPGFGPTFGNIVGGDGQTYSVERAWSNLAQACLAAPEIDVETTPFEYVHQSDDPCAGPIFGLGWSAQITVSGPGAFQGVELENNAGTFWQVLPPFVPIGTPLPVTLSVGPPKLGDASAAPDDCTVKISTTFNDDVVTIARPAPLPPGLIYSATVAAELTCETLTTLPPGWFNPAWIPDPPPVEGTYATDAGEVEASVQIVGSAFLWQGAPVTTSTARGTIDLPAQSFQMSGQLLVEPNGLAPFVAPFTVPVTMDVRGRMNGTSVTSLSLARTVTQTVSVNVSPLGVDPTLTFTLTIPEHAHHEGVTLFGVVPTTCAESGTCQPCSHDHHDDCGDGDDEHGGEGDDDGSD